MVGSARMLDGLYYFDESSFSCKITQDLTSISSLSIKEQIKLWHHRLGHPSFLHLKYLFRKLFMGIDCSPFHCESCILAKNQLSTYLSKILQNIKTILFKS